MNRGRGGNVRGGGGGGSRGGGRVGGYGNARQTGPAPTSESPPPKRDVQQSKPVLSPCLNGEPSVPACTGSKEEISCIESSLRDKTSESPSSPIVEPPFQVSTLSMNRGRGGNVRGGGGGGSGGGGYGNARRTGPAPTSESPPPKRDVQQSKPVLSPCLNGEPSVPACTESKEESSCIGSSLQDQASQFPSSPIVDSPFQHAGGPLRPVHFGSKDRPSKNTGSQCGQTSSDIVPSDGNSENSEPSLVVKSFDICLMKKGTTVQLKRPLFDKNRERRKEDDRLKNGPEHCPLRPGMVLLKNFLSHSDQIKIVKLCKNLGVGQGGFQQPGYKDGAQLQLMMMCLGKHWDPETGLYGDKRPTDGHVPPGIPAELTMLVKEAIQASHTFLKQKKKEKNPEEVLPSMQPDICIVNFYTNSGKLGLHQDKDESKESLDKGLPVVSFSIGDSAEFLYGDHRDVEKAEKEVLESGDVLIFGGTSRRIFHGVQCISPGTAPKTLLDDTNLRPGRLNLTFRKF